MPFVRLRTRTSDGKVHRGNGDGEPRCRARRGSKCATQGGDARKWEEVDEDKYPRSWWDRCERCFGGDDS
jgi:hypothetical protein